MKAKSLGNFDKISQRLSLKKNLPFFCCCLSAKMGVDYYACKQCQEVYTTSGPSWPCEKCNDDIYCENCVTYGESHFKLSNGKSVLLCMDCFPQDSIKKVEYVDNPHYKEKVQELHAFFGIKKDEDGEEEEEEEEEKEKSDDAPPAKKQKVDHDDDGDNDKDE
jgi:hypothetical protein